MGHQEDLTRYVANFVDELICNGMTDVVISPGSRSTPLALTFAEHPSIKEWIIIDERSAAFFAMGIAKQTKRPVALVCTSGTAAANYFPAIVESHYSRVPLVVLTGDRPHELRDVGAPQAIEQMKLYGDYVKWFQEMALPESSELMLSYVRSKAARAVFMAGSENPGPVHLNFPFREPLHPDFSLKNIWGEHAENSYHPTNEGTKRLDEFQIRKLVEKISEKQKGVIVCGPQTDENLAVAITTFAAKWGMPILADPLSQLRAGNHEKDNIIDGYDAFLRNESIRKRLKPDLIIRFGAMPVSKAYLFYVKENPDVEQIVVESNLGFREPAGNRTEFVFADPVLLCEDLTRYSHEQTHEWLNIWQEMNAVAEKHLHNGTEAMITEGEAVRGLSQVIPNNSSLYVGNSMAIRDVDTFFRKNSKSIEVLANRGANGIDGMVSSALGAATAGKPMTLLIGDLSFFHDMNGLLAAKHYQLNMTMILVNNNGGGIFSFLPQANDRKHFELLFGTPANIEFAKAVELYDGDYNLAKTEEELKQLLEKSYDHKGLNVIEVKTDREENTKWHRMKWQAIQEEILQG